MHTNQTLTRHVRAAAEREARRDAAGALAAETLLRALSDLEAAR